MKDTMEKLVDGLLAEDENAIPWDYNWICACEQVEDSEYDTEGPDDILGPEQALKRAHPRPW